MPLTITRVGGMLPTLRPTVTVRLEALDEPTRQAVCDFFEKPAAAEVARRGPMVYVFELTEAAPGMPAGERSCSYAEVPEVLRALLPGPT